MKEIKFNINEKPQLRNASVAYVIDKTNVDVMCQYVNKYYGHIQAWEKHSWTDWYNAVIAGRIRKNPNDSYILYFQHNSLSWDYNNLPGSSAWDYNKSAIAYRHGYDMYYIVAAPALITIE